MRVYFEITVGNIVRYNAHVKPPCSDDILLVFDDNQDWPEGNSLLHVECYKGWTSAKLKNFILSNNVEEVVVNSFRLTDVVIIKLCNLAGIKVTYVQHGQYTSYVKRNLSFYLRISRAYHFLKIYFSCFGFEVSSISYLLALLGVGNRRLFSSKHIHIENAFVWSDFWLDWHNKNYWFHASNTFVTGDPNLSLLKYVYGPRSNAVLFVSQSLVEDGRLSFRKYKRKLLCLRQLLIKAGYVDFYFRQHPRQSMKILALFEQLGFRSDRSIAALEVALCVGSYSSVLPSISRLNIPIALVQLDDQVIPEYFSVLGSFIDLNEVNSVVSTSQPDIEKVNFYWGG